jgi:hypothetical protein
MSDKQNIQTATMLKNVEPLFDKEGKQAAIKFEDIDGAKFGTLLGPKEATQLLYTAIRVCQHLPPNRPNPNDSAEESFLTTEIENIEFWPGRTSTEVQLRIFSGGLRLAVWINLDLFLAHWGELISRIEKDPRVPDQIQ